MHLRDPSACRAEDTREVELLGPSDFDELRAYFDRDAYLPHETGGLFFDARMLEAGCYRAIRQEGRIVEAGGIHVKASIYCSQP